MKSDDEQLREIEGKLDQLRGFKSSNTGIFFSAAVEALDRAQVVSNVREEAGRFVQSPPENPTKNYFAEALVAGYALPKFTATAIVFSALCVESLINFAVDAKLSKFYVQGLDKLDIPTKWVVVLKQAYGHDLDPGDNLVGQLKELATARNRLVHSKPRTLVREDLQIVRDTSLSLEEARQAVRTVRKAISYLHSIDSTLTEWSDVRLTSLF